MARTSGEDWRRVLDLTLRLTQRSVFSEFKGTALGRLWSFINPLATVTVFALIFALPVLVIYFVVNRKFGFRFYGGIKS